MKLFVKYCGGCNSSYDRVEFLERLLMEFPSAEIVQNPDGADFVLVLCGCSAICVSHHTLNGRLGKFIVSSVNDYPCLYNQLQKMALLNG